MTQLANVFSHDDRDVEVQVFRSLELVREAWLSLEEEAHCFGFQCYSWLSTVWETVAGKRPGQLAIVLVTDTSNTPLMLIPLVKRTNSGVTVLEFIDDELSDYNAPLVQRDFIHELLGDGFLDLWKKILDRVGPVDVIRFEKMPPTIDGIMNPMLSLGCQQEHVAFQASLSGGFDAYVKLRTSHLMRNLRRCKRNLAKLGTVELRTISNPEEAIILMDEMIRHKSARYKATGTRDMFASNPAYIDFYHEICRREVGGLICTGSLTVDDRIVASHLGLIFRDRFYGLVQAADYENFGPYSPGGLLMLELIEWCSKRGIMVFDFSIGSEAYKTGWTDETMPLYRYDQGTTALGKIISMPRQGYAWLNVQIRRNQRLFLSLKSTKAKLKRMRARVANR